MNRLPNMLSFSIAFYDVSDKEAMADWLEALFAELGRKRLQLRFRSGRKWKVGRFGKLADFLSPHEQVESNLGFMAADGDYDQPASIGAMYNEYGGVNALVVSLLSEKSENLRDSRSKAREFLVRSPCEYGLGIIRPWDTMPDFSLMGTRIFGRNDRERLLCGGLWFETGDFDPEILGYRRRYAKGRLIEICDLNILTRKHLDFAVGDVTIEQLLAQQKVALERVGSNYLFFASDEQIEILQKMLAPAILLRNSDAGYTAHMFDI